VTEMMGKLTGFQAAFLTCREVKISIKWRRAESLATKLTK